MQSERGTDYSPPLDVKVSTTKISHSKSLTNPKCRSVNLPVTAVGTVLSNPSNIPHVICACTLQGFTALQLTVPSVSLHLQALLSSSFYVSSPNKVIHSSSLCIPLQQELVLIRYVGHRELFPGGRLPYGFEIALCNEKQSFTSPLRPALRQKS